MEPAGVDIPALLRRTFPLWLAWVLYAAPLTWAVLVYRALTTSPDLPFNGTGTFDENGTVIENDPVGPSSMGWLARFGLSLVMMFGSPSPAPSELPLFGLVAAVVVTAVWTVRGRSFHLRSVAAVGAAFSFPLGVVGLLVVVSRNAAYEAVEPMWSTDGSGPFDGQFAMWGVVGVLGAILAWGFARLGFGPLPTVQASDSPVIPELQVTAGAALGPDAGGPAGLAAPDWDARPELPPDFVAPEAGSSPFERPGGQSNWATEAPGEPVEAAFVEDPLAVYRRPSGPDS